MPEPSLSFELMKCTFARYSPHYSILILCFLIAGSTLSQQQSYTQYDVNNGLAGSTVYAMLQDHDGFMWFGTETGVSRFDGTHFKNFGIDDGMPDNEILRMFEDSKGRIWMIPFRKTLFYYYKGKFYSARNDSLLKKIKSKSYLQGIAEDKDGNILVQDQDKLFLITKQGLKVFTQIGGRTISDCMAISRGINGGFLVIIRNELFEFKDQEFHPLLKTGLSYYNLKFVELNESMLAFKSSRNVVSFINLKNNSTGVYPLLGGESDNIQLFGDSIIITNGHEGSMFHFMNGERDNKQFLADKTVSRCFVDKEGNYWFATIGNGVFRLSSENISSLILRNKEGRRLNVNFVTGTGNKWLVGANEMTVFAIVRDSASRRARLIWDEYETKPNSRTLAIEEIGPNLYLVGTDQMLEKIPLSREAILHEKTEMAVKSIVRLPSNDFLVASNRGVYSVNAASPLALKDTFWDERAISAYYFDDTVFVGTLDGLFLTANDKSRVFAGDRDTLLQNRVVCMRSSGDGILWIASDGAGLMKYYKGKVIQRITTEDGLSSNNCRTLWVSNDELWVGTDKGLNRIILSPQGFGITKLTMGDGLSSNLINSIYVDGDTVLVATPEALNYFDKTRLSFQSLCNLVIDKIIVSNHEVPISTRSFSLPHKDNNIRFEFAGISFRSGGEMSYEYQLAGLDTFWKTTTDNFLNYPTLPSGDYMLALRAVNKFGIKSNVISIPFSVERLTTEKTWFRLLMLFVVVAIISLALLFFARRARKKEEERNKIRNRISELEQLALKSQMNPHFIFNCLNSIQQFVIDKDVSGSNRFITRFSRLIRQTLDISAKKEISLSEEIMYLSTYLELEKTRFESKFKYEFQVADDLNDAEYHIPPMMLQPFVENSIRHGIRYRKDNKGIILVGFEKSEGQLVCIIEDNGIGRSEALRLKSASPIEYQSKGMSLIASRIEYLNRDSNSTITLQVEDLMDEGQPLGTRVVMKFPLNNTYNY